MSQKCGAALDKRNEDLCKNSAKLRNCPGLYESVPRYYRGIGPQILGFNFKKIGQQVTKNQKWDKIKNK